MAWLPVDYAMLNTSIASWLVTVHCKMPPTKPMEALPIGISQFSDPAMNLS